MKSKVKGIVRKVIAKAGFSLERIERTYPLDLRGTNLQGGAISYLVEAQSALINAPLQLGRGLPLFTFSQEGCHPYVHAVKKASSLSTDKMEESISSTLSAYYEMVRPSNAYELLDLIDDDAPAISDSPAWMAPMPWDRDGPEEWSKKHAFSVEIENRIVGKGIDISEGWAWVGPVSDKKLLVEARRLNAVMQSIKINGYKRNDGPDGDVLGILLINDHGDYRWQAITGQHRASVLGAFGCEDIPVRIVRVVNRRDVDCWPNVQSSLYTRQAALKVFDLVFDGKASAVASSWVELVKNKGVMSSGG